MILCKKVFISLFVVFIIFSCTKNDEALDNLSDLYFSVDTLKYDTIFSRIPSTTKKIKIYNKSRHSMFFDEIILDNPNSYYRLNVNGDNSGVYTDISVPANDSLYIFVNVDARYMHEDKPIEIVDEIIFKRGEYNKTMVLQTYIQDVIFLNNEVLTSQTLNSKLPYLVQKHINVPQGNILTITDSTNIFFQKNTSLNISGALIIEGKYGKPVVFRNSRLEKIYNNIPAQWDGINIENSDMVSSINYLICENAVNAIKIKNCKQEIKIENTILKNFSENAITVDNSNLILNNTLIANCANSCLYIYNNSVVKVLHCTLVNYWSYFSYLSNSINITLASKVEVINSIIYGHSYKQVNVSNTKQDIRINNCLIKLPDNNILEYKDVLGDNIYNQKPEFIDVKDYNFFLKDNSPAINTASLEHSLLLKHDLNDVLRVGVGILPDMGSYQYTVFPE